MPTTSATAPMTAACQPTHAAACLGVSPSARSTATSRRARRHPRQQRMGHGTDGQQHEEGGQPQRQAANVGEVGDVRRLDRAGDAEAIGGEVVTTRVDEQPRAGRISASSSLNVSPTAVRNPHWREQRALVEGAVRRLGQQRDAGHLEALAGPPAITLSPMWAWILAAVPGPSATSSALCGPRPSSVTKWMSPCSRSSAYRGASTSFTTEGTRDRRAKAVTAGMADKTFVPSADAQRRVGLEIPGLAGPLRLVQRVVDTADEGHGPHHAEDAHHRGQECGPARRAPTAWAPARGPGSSPRRRGTDAPARVATPTSWVRGPGAHRPPVAR